jgi:transposase
MIDSETRVQICRFYFAEHWKVGTIAAELHIHPDTVRRAIDVEKSHNVMFQRATLVAPYLPFLRETLEAHPRLCVTRLYRMLEDRGYAGSIRQLRRSVESLRPRPQEAFLRTQVYVGEQAQVDWAHFGTVMVGKARRTLSCFVMTLSWSRALYLEFFFDQTMENFLRGHVHAFESFYGCARVLLYDNLKSAVLDRHGSHVHFNPRLLELAGHYHFVPRPCQVRAGNQKGRVERAIRYVRDSFWPARSFTTLEECNRQARRWVEEVAHKRPWPDDHNRAVADAFLDEKPRLLPLPLHPFNTDHVVPVRSAKTIYVRFDGNDYSIPPEHVGCTLTLAATDIEVRILDGSSEVARHRRSYDRQQMVLDPEHQNALLLSKRKARESTRDGRLEIAIPESALLLERAFVQGESATQQRIQLIELLDRYGEKALRQAVHEAIERNTPRASSVAFLLRQQHRTTSMPLDLSRYPLAQDVHVRSHDLETYDELARNRDKKSTS